MLKNENTSLRTNFKFIKKFKISQDIFLEKNTEIHRLTIFI